MSCDIVKVFLFNIKEALNFFAIKRKCKKNLRTFIDLYISPSCTEELHEMRTRFTRGEKNCKEQRRVNNTRDGLQKTTRRYMEEVCLVSSAVCKPMSLGRLGAIYIRHEKLATMHGATIA